MSRLQERQQQMMDFLLNGDDAIASQLATSADIDARQRLNIYYQGYRLRLKETLEVDHEILASYLGDELFAKLADEYVEANPSRYKSLRQYAQELPKFLTVNEYFSQYPQLAELAGFERILLDSFDAFEAQRLEANFLTSLAPEAWPNCHLALHPSVQIWHCDYNSVEIWQALKHSQTPPAPLEQVSSWVLWRSQDRLTEFTSLNGVELSVLESIQQGQCLTEICEALLNLVPEDEVPMALVQSLQPMLNNGLLIAGATAAVPKERRI